MVILTVCQKALLAAYDVSRYLDRVSLYLTDCLQRVRISLPSLSDKIC